MRCFRLAFFSQIVGSDKALAWMSTEELASWLLKQTRTELFLFCTISKYCRVELLLGRRTYICWIVYWQYLFVSGSCKPQCSVATLAPVILYVSPFARCRTVASGIAYNRKRDLKSSEILFHSIFLSEFKTCLLCDVLKAKTLGPYLIKLPYLDFIFEPTNVSAIAYTVTWSGSYRGCRWKFFPSSFKYCLCLFLFWKKSANSRTSRYCEWSVINADIFF